MFEYEIPNTKWANVDLVGEFYRQKAIASLIGGRPKGEESKQVDMKVHLVPEPDNPFGSQGQAISARINGKVVGYLSNADAKKWHREIHRITASGATATTTGNIFAYNRTKWNQNGQTSRELEINIRVALPEPGFITPLNVQDISDFAVLPWGNALQVIGEDQHLDHLFEYVPTSGEGLVVLSLHRIEKRLKNGTVKELVEARLDGERVGQLTPASSLHYLPTIAHAHDMGKTLAVWSKLKGSGLAVELTVQGARAAELSDEWLASMPSLPAFVPEADSYDVPNAYIPDKVSQPKSGRPVTTSRSSAVSLTPAGAAVPLPSPSIEYAEDQENTAIYVNGKRSVKFSDKQRKFSPGTYSTAAWVSLICFCLLGLLCLSGGAIGLIFTAAFFGLGILLFRGQRLMAEALRFERTQGSTTAP